MAFMLKAVRCGKTFCPWRVSGFCPSPYISLSNTYGSYTVGSNPAKPGNGVDRKVRQGL